MDLLGSDSIDLCDDSTLVGHADERMLDVGWREKPLPRIPSLISMRSNTTLRDVQALPNVAAALQPSSPTRTLHAPTPIGPPDLLLPAKPTQTKAHVSAGYIQTYSSRTSSCVLVAPGTDVKTVVRGPFTIVNVTDNDAICLEKSQMPGNILSRIRGRDAPFPQKLSEPNGTLTIVTPKGPCGQRDGDVSSSITSRKEQEASDMSSTASYSVEVPIPQNSLAPASPLLPQRVHSPLTLTTPYPMSSVVVRNIGAFRRSDGSKGTRRVVTMSVLVDGHRNPVSSGSAAEDLGLFRGAQNTSSEGNEDILRQILERYTGKRSTFSTTSTRDLPPYSPIQKELESSRP